MEVKSSCFAAAENLFTMENGLVDNYPGDLWERGRFADIENIYCGLKDLVIVDGWIFGTQYGFPGATSAICTAGRRLVNDPSRINIHLPVMSDSSV